MAPVPVKGANTLLRRALSAAVLLLFFAFRPPVVPAETWEKLEAAGAVIDSIDIATGDVFDFTDPDQDHLLGRLANFVHIRSRQHIVAREMLFSEGAPVRAALVRETERNLRALGYIREARILPERGSGGALKAVVVTEDAWSLKGGFKFRYEGGDAEWGVDLEEVNFLGFGKALRLGYEDERERNTFRTGYRDTRLLGSRWQLRASYDDLSDGRRRRLSLRRPFFALETEWAAVAALFSEESSVRLYDLGDEVMTIPSQFDEVRFGLWKALPPEKRSVLRLGIEYRVDDAVYAPPVTVRERGLPEPVTDSRDLHGLFFAVQYLEDRHFVTRNMASIGRTEDVNAGWNVRAAAGYFSKVLGGGEEALALECGVRRTWRAGKEITARAVLAAEGRYRDGHWEETLAAMKLSAYDQHLPGHTIAVRSSFTGGNRLAPEHWLTIGADTGLRGYVNDFRSGDRRWTVSIDDWIVTGREYWGLARLGFTFFGDLGAIRRFDTGEWSRLYADVGGGLRIGNLKSAFGRVVLATIAVPLVKGEGVHDFEIFVGNEIPF